MMWNSGDLDLIHFQDSFANLNDYDDFDIAPESPNTPNIPYV